MEKVNGLLLSNILIWMLAPMSLALSAQTTVPPAAIGPSTVALVEAWPDGRTSVELTSVRRAVMWTPLFPRVDDYRPAAGAAPVYAVQFARIVVDGNIRVDVSVLLGTAAPPAVPVATVMVTRGSRIRVEELSAFGVQPVTLSMVDVAPFTPYPPSVASASPSIVVDAVELLSAPYPGYRITLRNVGLKGVSSVHVQSYREQNRALSALKRSDDGRPMMWPGGTYTFDLTLTSGPITPSVDFRWWAPAPLDVIEFDAIRWDDGSYDGTPPYPQADGGVEADSGRRLQLGRIVSSLRQCLEHSSDTTLVPCVREGLLKLPDSEPDQVRLARVAMQGTKAAVVGDLVRYESAVHLDVPPTEWLRELIRRYEGWLARLSPP